MRRLYLIVLALLWGLPAWGQALPPSTAAVCLGTANPPAMSENRYGPLSCDLSGGLRLSGGTNSVLTTSNMAGPAPVVGTGSSLVVKNSAANLYGFSITSGGTATYLAMLNASAVPAAGAAISPLECVPVPVNGYVARRQPLPDRFTTGVVFLSTSSCTTFTAVAPQVMSGVVQ